MNGILVGLIIFISILLLTGLGVGLYFLLRNENKSKNDGEHSKHGTIDPFPPSNSPIQGKGNVYQNVTDSLSIWTIKSPAYPNGALINAPFDGICNNYLFDLGKINTMNGSVNNALIWEGDGTSILGFSSYTGVGSGITLTDPKTWDQQKWGSEDISWAYDSNNKTWCSTFIPNLCIQNTSPFLTMQILPSNFSSLSSSDTIKKSFQWSQGTCKTSR